MSVDTRATVHCLAELSQIRGINTELREVTYVAATEIGVRTFGGVEVLRMSGMTPRRFVPFLDSHRQGDARAVIGSLTHQVVGRELHITVRYAKSERAVELFDLVAGGFIQAVSVGWITDESRFIEAGEVDGEGEAAISGPARIITKWTLIEVSQVALGADENALRRSALEGFSMDPVTPNSATPAAAATPVAPATPAAAARIVPPVVAENEREILCRTVRALAGSEMRSFADKILIETVDLDETKARALLLKEHARLHPPVGTPSQPEVNVATVAEADTTKRDLTNDDVVGALTSLRG